MTDSPEVTAPPRREKKQYLKELLDSYRDSERRFRNIITQAPLGMQMYRLTPEGSLLLIGANPAADYLLGLDHDSLIGKSIEEAFPDLHETEIPEAYNRVAKEGKPWKSERVIHKDHLVLLAYEIHAFQTSPGIMVATFTDITARKLAEEELEKTRAEIEERIETLSRLASEREPGDPSILDPLTGVYNRKYFFQILQSEVERTLRTHRPLGFIMVGIDHFGEINEKFGRDAGECVLQKTALVLKRRVRKLDCVVRYEENEFLIILPETGETIEIVSQGIVADARQDSDLQGCVEQEITLTCGASFWDPDGPESPEEAVERADASRTK